MTAVLRIVFPETVPMMPTGRVVRRKAQMRVLEPAPVDLEMWDGRRFRLTTIEAGFVFDGTSWPEILVGPENPFDDAWWGALFHDWLLELMRRGVFQKPKMLVDLLYLMTLVSTGVPFFRASLMFLGVRTRKYRAPEMPAG